jgi:tetratricopeptide (TPR) repeat protein
MPLLAEVGFNGNRALQVWYRDSTLTLRFFGEEAGMRERSDAVIEIEANRPWPAVLIHPEAMRRYREAFRADAEGRTRAADSLLTAAWQAQPEDAPRFFANLAQNQAQLALKMDEYARADSFNRLNYQLNGESAPYWAIAARLALQRGDLALAKNALRRCLALDPSDPTGREFARRLGITPSTAPR